MPLGCCRAQSEEGEWKDIYGDPVRPRRTGYELPPDALQIGAWCAIVVLSVLHFTVQIPCYTGAFFIVVVVISAVLIASVFVTKVTLELYPQQDAAVFQVDLPRLDQDQLLTELAPPGMEPCVFCRRFVQEGCKHCSVCDKCVPGFDHHCRWLNSCVGTKNYRLFATFMGVAWAGMAWVGALSLYTIQLMLRDISAFKTHMRTRAYHSSPRAFPALVVFNFLCLLIALAGTCALGKLIYFHFYLHITHQSTYEHIVKQREKQKAAGKYHIGSGDATNTGLLGCLGVRKRRNFKKHRGEAAAGEGGDEEGDAPNVDEGGGDYEMRCGDSGARPATWDGGAVGVGFGTAAAAATSSTTPRRRRCSTGLVANSGSDPGRKAPEEEDDDEEEGQDGGCDRRAVPPPNGRYQWYTPVPETGGERSADRFTSISLSHGTHEPVEAPAER